MKLNRNVPNFLVEEGLKYQAQQMKAWKKMLVPEVYAKLEEIVNGKNKQLIPHNTGNDVFRGIDISAELTNSIMDDYIE